jgi:Ca2+-binding EF-hand superfamily protein
MLVSMQKVDQDLIDEIRELFVRLDAQENGVLQKRDLELLAQRRKNRMRQIGSTVRNGEFV